MLSNILIVAAAVLIAAGLIGLKCKTPGRRLVCVGVAQLGMIVLACAELNTYGLVGGCFQIIFRVAAWIPCVLLMCAVCKKNAVGSLEDLNGIGRDMPYCSALLAIFSVLLIGVPITGTFTGMIYAMIGLLAGSFGVFTYVGFAACAVGIAVPALLLLPMLRRMYFPYATENIEADESAEQTVEAKTDEDADQTEESETDENAEQTVEAKTDESAEQTVGPETDEDVDQTEGAVAPGRARMAVCTVLAVALVVFSLYQQPILETASTIIQNIFG